MQCAASHQLQYTTLSLIMIVASGCQCKGSSAPSFGSSVEDEDSVRPGH